MTLPPSTASIKSAFRELMESRDLLSTSRVTCEGKKTIVIIFSIFLLDNLRHDLMESCAPYPGPLLLQYPGGLASSPQDRDGLQAPIYLSQAAFDRRQNGEELIVAVWKTEFFSWAIPSHQENWQYKTGRRITACRVYNHSGMTEVLGQPLCRAVPSCLKLCLLSLSD